MGDVAAVEHPAVAHGEQQHAPHEQPQRPPRPRLVGGDEGADGLDGIVGDDRVAREGEAHPHGDLRVRVGHTGHQKTQAEDRQKNFLSHQHHHEAPRDGRIRGRGSVRVVHGGPGGTGADCVLGRPEIKPRDAGASGPRKTAPCGRETRPARPKLAGTPRPWKAQKPRVSPPSVRPMGRRPEGIRGRRSLGTATARWPGLDRTGPDSVPPCASP